MAWAEGAAPVETVVTTEAVVAGATVSMTRRGRTAKKGLRRRAAGAER